MKTGKLLTPLQSMRLAMIQSVDRQRAIEVIAAHLQYAESAAGRHDGGGNTPRDWYGKRGRRRDS